MAHQPNGAPNRTAMVVIAVIVVLLAFGGGYVLANNDSGTTANPSGSATGATPTAHPSRSHSPKPSASPDATPSSEPSGALPDGRHFVYVKKVEGGEEGPLLLTFDLAYFYTGDKANEVAASRGDEVPVPNDVYIVNDNPKTRRYPISPTVLVKYIPSGSALKKGDIGAFEHAVNGTAQTDYPDMRYTGWWIVLTNGEVSSIKQQYLP